MKILTAALALILLLVGSVLLQGEIDNDYNPGGDED
jgi:hypothetical protein